MQKKSTQSILIIEAATRSAQAETKTLQKHNYGVTSVSKIAEIKSLLKADVAIDLILVEINDQDNVRIFGMAGTALARYDVPLLIISADLALEALLEIEDLDCYGYIPKGCAESQLLASVKAALRLHRSRKLELETKQSLSERNFRQLLEESPISLWKEDFGPIIDHLEQLKKSGVTDFRKYLDEHPDEVRTIGQKLVVLDVNKASVKMFKATSKADLIQNLHKTFTERTYQVLKEEIIVLTKDLREYSSEGEVQTLTGEKLEVLISITLGLEDLPGKRTVGSHGMVSIKDISKSKRVESELKVAKEYLENLLTTANTLII
ncbi:MAG: hypothetical protein L3J79_12580, partial [Candidatus Marinimicrobia bacterium]|nr:hypothetical protein [Candidatus Neomarinimicrobiota bacterium]